MGEIAEMMLDGTLCEGCGEFIGSDAGFPQYCSPDCAKGRGVDLTCDSPRQRRAAANRPEVIAARKPYSCPDCGRRFRIEAAIAQHQRDTHKPA